jgi:NAD(P)-dependent dehydrogenase (short-subunit alcohol dehydrogenase family)
MGTLEGKVAIVTGGGRGIGRAIAEAYLQEGAAVTITAAREQAELNQMTQLNSSTQMLALLADVADPQVCELVVEQTIRRFGKIDVLVNNAGRGMKYVSPSFMTEPTHFWEVAPETWSMIIDTNVNGPFYMTRAVVTHMLAQRWSGSIINISIAHGTMKRRGFSPYGPSKAALDAASVIWAQDLVDSGIRVNVLLPGGATRTGMVPADVPEQVQSRLLAPEIIQAPAVFLASDASREITGHRLIAAEWSLEEPQGRAIFEEIS